MYIFAKQFIWQDELKDQHKRHKICCQKPAIRHKTHEIRSESRKVKC